MRRVALKALLGAVVLWLGAGCEPVSEPPVNGVTDGGDDAERVDAGPNPVDAGPASDAGEVDLVFMRLTPAGALDPTFGTAGIARIDLGGEAGNVRDALWGMAADSQNRLVAFAAKKGAGSRIDFDRAVVRLTASGALDPSFADGGVHTLDIGGVGDIPKHGLVQADGKIVASGYSLMPTGVGAQSANRIVLLRLNDDGTPDNTFGFRGVVTSAPFTSNNPQTVQWGMVEAYAVAQQSTGAYVTTGYGRTASSGPVDVVNFRYSGDAGTFDVDWGIGGAFVFDQSGADDRGRDLVALPDDRLFVVGSTIASGTNLDAMALILTDGGAVATDHPAVDGGYTAFSFGRPEEAFFDVALAPSNLFVAAAGYQAGAVGGVTQDDDAILLVQQLDGSTRFIGAVPLSDTENDRFWAVAVDAAGKVYGAGFVTQGGDARFAVARFNADGSRDTSFGQGGLFSQNVATGGTIEAVRAVVIQSDGKIVLGGHAER